MSNQHNAIAQRIDALRIKWQEKSGEYPDWKVARWLMEPSDVELYMGMLKLESSPYGRLPELFVAMFTPFDDPATFSRKLTSDWLETYDKQKEKNPELSWDIASLKDKLSLSEEEHPGDELLLETLHSFSQFSGTHEKLVLSLVPRHVRSFADYNDWLIRLHKKGLPDNVNLMLLDHTTDRHLERSIRETYPESFTLEPGDMDLKGAVEELATSGNPADPQVQFRKCLFEMSKAVSHNRPDDVHLWGERMLTVTQRTGNKTFFASAHLVYAGFLMHFKNEKKTVQLLDQGIRVVKPLASDDREAGALLLQFYAYHGAQASMKKEYRDAFNWFMRQAETAEQTGLPEMAIGACKMAVYTAERKSKLQKEYLMAVQKGYQTGLQMSNEQLKVTEYAYLAHHYLINFEEKEPAKTEDLIKRMTDLYGERWREDISQILEQVKKKKEMPVPYASD